MATTLTTEQFAFHICNIISKDIEKKQFNDNWYIDLGIIKHDLPYDFNQNVFLTIIKDTFNFRDIHIEDFDYKLRLIGRFIVQKSYNANDFFESSRYLRSLAPTVQEAGIALNNFAKSIQDAIVESYPKK